MLQNLHSLLIFIVDLQTQGHYLNYRAIFKMCFHLIRLTSDVPIVCGMPCVCGFYYIIV